VTPTPLNPVNKASYAYWEYIMLKSSIEAVLKRKLLSGQQTFIKYISLLEACRVFTIASYQFIKCLMNNRIQMIYHEICITNQQYSSIYQWNVTKKIKMMYNEMNQ
jgi:hypothetical protein